jgi:hypothetical protein
MAAAMNRSMVEIGPKQRPRRHSDDESVNEPASLLEDEAVEMEEGIPAEETEPIERIEPEDTSGPPAFEE